jgi:hypothetical protein
VVDKGMGAKMKKTLVYILAIVFSLPCTALDLLKGISLYGLGWEPGSFTTVGYDYGSLYFIRTVKNKDYREERRLSDLQLNNDGFYTIAIFSQASIVLAGGNYFFICDPADPRYNMYRLDKDYAKFYKEHVFPHDFSYQYAVNGEKYRSIKSIKVPDVLVEDQGGMIVSYSTDDILKYYARQLDGQIVCNPDAKPWATSKDPIGMTIDVEFGAVQSISGGLLDNRSDHIVILNGYANPLKRYLYKANRRIKTLKIESLDAAPADAFSIVCNFKDEVAFKRISFPSMMPKVRLTILDFYEGDKYQDFCIQMIGTDFDLDGGELSFYQFKNSSTLWKQ